MKNKWLAEKLRQIFSAHKIILCLCIVVLLYAALFSRPKKNEYSKVQSKLKEFKAVVSEDIDVRSSSMLVTILPEGYSQQILLTVPKSRDVKYGNKVTVFGKVELPEAFNGFDYPGYLSVRNVYATMRYPRIEIAEGGGGSAWKEKVFALKHWYVEKLNEYIPERESGVVLGMVLGIKQNLAKEVQDIFSATGTSHILAASGYNVAIIVSVFSERLAKIFGRRISFILLLLMLCVYAMLAGLSASIIRASIMGAVLVFSRLIQRPYVGISSVLLAGAGMVIQNPLLARFDIGFQLSLLAVIGIIALTPYLEEKLFPKRELLGAKNILTVTIAATIATLPLILYNFGQLPIYSLIANIIVIPLVPFVMLSGALVLAPFVGPGFAYAAGTISAWILWVLEWISKLPHASIALRIPLWAMLVSYGAILILCIGIRKLKKTQFEGINSLW